MAQPKIEILLPELLKDFTIGFEKNELAFLSIQGKNEQQIRDKIAWRLQNAIDSMGVENIVVRREWSLGYISRSNKKNAKPDQVDIAVLQLEKDNESVDDKLKVKKILALIEFKAQSLVRPEKWYIDEFVKDVLKMRGMGEDDTQMYFVFLHSSQSSYGGPYTLMQAAQKYTNGKTVTCSSTDDEACKDEMQKEWQRFFQETVKGRYDKQDHTFRQAKGSPARPEIISLGEAYGIEYFTAAMLWGPKIKSEITIQEDL